MTVQRSGSLPRTPDEASGDRELEPRASTSTSSSPTNQDFPQMDPEDLHNINEESERREAFTTPSETGRAALPSHPPAEEPDASRIATQRGPAAMMARRAAHSNASGSGDVPAGIPTRCFLGDPKQPQARQEQREQQRQQQQQQKQKQKKQQQELPLLTQTMPLGERCIEEFWPLSLTRRPSAEMLQHLRVAAERHEDPIDAHNLAAVNAATPAEAAAATRTVPAELRGAREEREADVSVATSQKANRSSTKTRVINNGRDGANDSNSHCRNESNNHSSQLGKLQQQPVPCDIPCAGGGFFQPRGDCTVGSSDAVAVGRPAAAASSSTAGAAGSAAQQEARETDNLTSTQKSGAPDDLLDAGCESRPVQRRSSGSNDCCSNGISARNVQRLRCGTPCLEEASSELLKDAGSTHNQRPNSATFDALVSFNGGISSHGSNHPQEQDGVHEEEQPQHPLHTQPQRQAETLCKEGESQSPKVPQAQKQQQPQKPREFVRRLAYGLLMGHRAGGKERRPWLGRCNSSGSRISQTQQEQQQQSEQEKRQRQQQKQREEGTDWEACCLLQPADEKNDGLTSHSRSNSSSGTRWGGNRRAPSRLQRMAFSFGCFGEASQRKTEAHRESFNPATPAQQRPWRRHQETYADDGSLFPRGLANLKNTCFLNAALQALAGIPSFVASLQAGLPPEQGVGEAQRQGTSKDCDAPHDGNKGDASAAAAAACSSTTASPDSEEARGQQSQQLQQVQSQSEQQAQQQKDLVQEQLIRRQELLRRLRVQQERREKHQPECLGSLDEKQRKLLLREFFTLLCRLTCCPSIGPYGSGEETSPEDLTAQRPRESNSAATSKPDQQQQQHQRRQQRTPVLQCDTIRPERLRKALAAPLAGLLLNDCSMQQQQDCHEFLRGLIDLIHEILKTSRWEREEAAAAEQLLQLQAVSPVADLEPWVLTSFNSLRIPVSVDDDQQTQNHKKHMQAQLAGISTEDHESSEFGKAAEGDVGDVERAEKKWREYIKDQASPMADFFAGQLCSEIQCAGCRQSLFIYEPAWDLSLPLPVDGNKVSLNNLLEGFFGSEELEFSCSSCHSPACKAHRTIRYTHPPKVLLLQIKRFSASGQKRRTRVEYPLEELVIKTNSESATFRLIAVIEHNGNSCQSGHYVAYVRRRRFVIPVALPSSNAGTAQGRPETPRSSACSPSEFLKRIGILKGFTSSSSHSLRHPNGPSTAPFSGPSPKEPPHESSFKPPRPAMSFEGLADDGTEVGAASCRADKCNH
ncbi:hypothetical protein EPH_0038090 [Eimeria praecox]|uniref:USP domain-containing protein n=1 Tax=Eimeria praecox TaxID=51316 RepID=U6G8V3_9EIME|nr:hypothetical protein EPH_0038090 [Eimeria praecox]